MPNDNVVSTDTPVNYELNEERMKRDELLNSLPEILAEQDAAICELYEILLGE